MTKPQDLSSNPQLQLRLECSDKISRGVISKSEAVEQYLRLLGEDDDSILALKQYL